MRLKNVGGEVYLGAGVHYGSFTPSLAYPGKSNSVSYGTHFCANLSHRQGKSLWEGGT